MFSVHGITTLADYVHIVFNLPYVASPRQTICIALGKLIYVCTVITAMVVSRVSIHYEYTVLLV